MGNNQSTVSHHNRLSKPKTNTNSPSLAVAAESPVSASLRYADLSAKGRQQIKETLLSPVDNKHRPAVWSHKEDDGIGELGLRTRGRTSSVVSRSNSRTNSRSNSLSCFGSRHGSTAQLTELHGSKISVASKTQTMDMETAIRLLHEVKKNASPEDLAALHEALESPLDSTASTTEPGLSHRTSTINRSSSSLTRRRSLLQTPGVATRTSPGSARRKTWNSWKAPKLAPEEEAKCVVTSKGISPVHCLVALDLAEEGRNTPTPRAQTPGEMDYGHLGSLRLGSLSIVNGAPSPSPAPSTKNAKQMSCPVSEDDYFTAAEAGSSPLMMKSARRRGHAKSKSSVLPATASFYDSLPLSEIERTTQPLPQPSVFQENQKHQSFTVQLQVEPVKRVQTIDKSAVAPVHNAKSYAQDYQADIPKSPFGNTGKVSCVKEDGGFMSDDTTSLKEEAARIFAATIFDAPTTAIEISGSVLFSTATRETPSETKSSTNQRPSPRTADTADSGYSSGGSLRLADGFPQKSGLSTTSTEPSQAEVHQQQAFTSLASHQGRPYTATCLPLSTKTFKIDAYRHPLSLHIPDRSGRPSTSGSIISSTTPRSVTSASASDSTSSKAQRRLQRQRPSYSELPVVQSRQSISEGTIPGPPDCVRTKFARRLSNTPGAECLTHTFPSKDHVTVANSNPISNAIPAAPSEVIAQLAELEPERSPAPPVHRRRKSFSLFQRKSTVSTGDVDREDESNSLGVADFGTVASSLGSSPYDAAMSGPLRKTVTSPTHPHQLGGTLPRAKSMVNIDAKVASEFARMQSRSRALVEREASQQRRKSYQNLKADAGEAKASKRRPHSSLHDIPPVPSIDMSKLTVPHTARPRLQSKIQDEPPSNLNFSPRFRAKGQTISQVVDRDDHSGQSIPRRDVDWEAHSHTWAQRRKTIEEGLRTDARPSEASTSRVNSHNMPHNREDLAAWGRYSGGLAYEYEGRGVGIGGSAGTRQLHSSASSKSMHWRNQYGVDLSDVPIMLQRV